MSGYNYYTGYIPGVGEKELRKRRLKKRLFFGIFLIGLVIWFWSNSQESKMPEEKTVKKNSLLSNSQELAQDIKRAKKKKALVKTDTKRGDSAQNNIVSLMKKTHKKTTTMKPTEQVIIQQKSQEMVAPKKTEMRSATNTSQQGADKDNNVKQQKAIDVPSIDENDINEFLKQEGNLSF